MLTSTPVPSGWSDVFLTRRIGDVLWVCICESVAGRVMLRVCRSIRLWHHSRHECTCGLVASLERPGPGFGEKAKRELEALSCDISTVTPGRLYFRALGTATELRAARLVETVDVVVLRDTSARSLSEFDGASPEQCINQVVDAAMLVDWAGPLALWALLADRPFCQRESLSFKVRAKRSVTVSKGATACTSVDIQVHLGAALMERFGWRVDLTNPDLEVRVRQSKDELLISLSLLQAGVGSFGGNLAHAGLHPSVSWALAKTLNIQPQDTVLDPMCGRGIILCEAASCWPEAKSFIGCDLDVSQLAAAAENFARHRQSSHMQVVRANVGLTGGVPFASGSVQRLVADLPFGKKFGNDVENRSLYPAALAEFARVVSEDGCAVLLTSASNRQIMRAALAPDLSNSSGFAPLASAWRVEHRRAFWLFMKMDTCVYVLRRTANSPPTPGDAVEYTQRALAALEISEKNPCGEQPKPGRLGGVVGSLPWEGRCSWHEQWLRDRPALVPWTPPRRAGTPS